MGKATKALSAFIDNIPDNKLEGIPEGAGTIYKDQDFRLDNQGVYATTSGNQEPSS